MNQRESAIRHLRLYEKKGLGEIGAVFGITRQRVSQILNNYITLKPNLRKRYIRYRCEMCGKDDQSKLNIHHVDRNCHNNNENNMMTVCRKCHGLIESEARKRSGIEIFRANRRKLVTLPCLQCKAIFTFLCSVYNKNRKFCSTACASSSRKIHKDYKERNRVRTLKFYHRHKNELHYIEKRREYNKRAVEKLKAKKVDKI